MTRLWATGESVQVVVAGPRGVHDEGAGASRAVAPGAAPVRFQLRGEWYEVAFIVNRWRVYTTWWLPEADAQREYVKLVSTDGLLCTLYCDLRDGAWYCARIYD